MRNAAKAKPTRPLTRNRGASAGDAGKLGECIELGQFVVADPRICHGKLTYRGTRIMVWQILEALAAGESVDQLVAAWGGRVSHAAILETIFLPSGKLLDRHGQLNRHLNDQLTAGILSKKHP
jgi:uncharacterized protein (DUF433 family)